MTTLTDLSETVDSLRREGIAALDTEFVWERTYYPGLGVVQLGSSDGRAWAWDALSPETPLPLAELLADRGTVKILHDARQDLTLLARYAGEMPLSIFDTRIAAGFAGLSSTISLQQLLQETLGVVLSKTETRTDWRRRPLSEAQLSYALDDVRHLGELRQHLTRAAEERGAGDWLAEEMRTFDDPALYVERPPEEAWLRVKGGGRLSPHARAVLRAVAAFREEQAVAQNRPRSWVLPDEALVALAENPPAGLGELAIRKMLPRGSPDSFAEGLLAAIEGALRLTAPELPAVARSRTDEETKRRVEDVLKFLRRRAEELRIDVALFGSRAQITDVVARPEFAGHLLTQGWRYQAAGRDILESRMG